jgi:hypothetical protein
MMDSLQQFLAEFNELLLVVTLEGVLDPKDLVDPVDLLEDNVELSDDRIDTWTYIPQAHNISPHTRRIEKLAAARPSSQVLLLQLKGVAGGEPTLFDDELPRGL